MRVFIVSVSNQSKKLKEILSYSKTLKRLGTLRMHEGYASLIAATSFLDSNTTIIQQRLWHVENNMFDIPKCKMCNNKTSWRKETRSYNVYCSSKCAHGDPEILEKVRLTNLKKYGQATSMTTPAVRTKIKEKYGVDNISQLQHVKDKKRETALRHFGTDHPQQCNEIQTKTKTTNLKKYGHTNVLASTHGKNKTYETNLKKYGVKHFAYRKYADIVHLVTNPDWLLEQHTNHEKSFEQISIECRDFDPSTLIARVRSKYPEFVPTQYFCSTGQTQVSQFLTDINVDHETNIRTIISPYELDIYLPSHNIAIEYCGLYWHSEQQGKDRNYHKNKMIMCQQKNIRLLTIYEDEWLNKPQIIKSKLLHLLNQSTNKIFAKNTTIDVINTTTKQQFFNDNHIQCDGPGSINIGLLHNDVLVACMSFIKQTNKIFVLNRYATSIHVVGGFSKLLKYFKQYYQWKQIISFADLRWSEGNVYKVNGFTLDKTLPPDYYYSPDGHTRFHKFNYRRKNLPNLLEDFNPALSETANCNNNGILRIWDCGKYKWVLENNN